jgi:alpha-beta hydrolase superfamily lysophospholipase
MCRSTKADFTWLASSLSLAGEHCGRYGWFGSQLAWAGLDVLSMDLTGHGRTAGGMGLGRDIESWEALVDDAEDLFRTTCMGDEAKDAPFYIFGEPFTSKVV